MFHKKTGRKRNNLRKFSKLMFKKKLMNKNQRDQQQIKTLKRKQSREEKVKELLPKKELSKTNWITFKRSKM